MLRRLLIITLAATAFMAPAQKKTQSVLDLKSTITDDAIIFPESFEQDTQKMLEGWYMKNYTAGDESNRKSHDVNFSDTEYMARLSALPTIIDLPYNQIVKKYIERYTKSGRSQLSAILGLSIFYMPIFEQVLEEQNLPIELKYIPVIESALNPNAVSKAGATGLWQLMSATAKGLDMEVNSLVDQRRDPYLSSQRAVKFLKDLYDTYGDWSLVIAAYNCGPGTVNKAIRRAGGDPKDHDFWSIYSYLPAETRGYVPMFIAANYVMNYYRDHNISPVLPTKPLVVDTIHISNRVHFNQIASILNIPVEEIRLLNPQYRADIIPATATNQYSLALPSQQVQAYIVSEDKILAYQADKYARQTVAEPAAAPSDVAVLETEEVRTEVENDVDDSGTPTNFDDIPAVADLPEPVATPKKSTPRPVSVKKLSPGQSVTHKVQEGESLATIANLYGVTPDAIKASNNLRRNSVRVGQQLKVEAPGKAQPSQTSRQQSASLAQAKSQEKKTTAQTAENSQDSKQSQAGTSSSSRRAAQAANADNSSAKTSQKTKRENNVAAAGTSSKKSNKTTDSKKGKKSSTSKKETAAPKEHTIKEGESLSTIARRNGVTVDELRAANNMKGDNIRAGKTLKIPAKGKKDSSSSKSSSAKKSKKKKR